MRLSDIRGERALDVLADFMLLAESLSDDEDFCAFVKALRESGADDAWMAFCKLAPVLRKPDVKKRIVAVIANAKQVDPEEFAESGDVLGELWELLTSDVAAMGFLAQQ